MDRHRFFDTRRQCKHNQLATAHIEHKNPLEFLSSRKPCKSRQFSAISAHLCECCYAGHSIQGALAERLINSRPTGASCSSEVSWVYSQVVRYTTCKSIIALSRTAACGKTNPMTVRHTNMHKAMSADAKPTTTPSQGSASVDRRFASAHCALSHVRNATANGPRNKRSRSVRSGRLMAARPRPAMVVPVMRSPTRSRLRGELTSNRWTVITSGGLMSNSGGKSRTRSMSAFSPRVMPKTSWGRIKRQMQTAA